MIEELPVRSRRRPALLALAVLFGATALAACGGGGDVTRDGLRGDVADWLVDPGTGSEREPLSENDADTGGTCVANAVFDDSVDDPFPRDPRNDIATASSDGEAPDADLAERFGEIVDDCLAELDAPS